MPWHAFKWKRSEGGGRQEIKERVTGRGRERNGKVGRRKRMEGKQVRQKRKTGRGWPRRQPKSKRKKRKKKEKPKFALPQKMEEKKRDKKKIPRYPNRTKYRGCTGEPSVGNTFWGRRFLGTPLEDTPIHQTSPCPPIVLTLAPRLKCQYQHRKGRKRDNGNQPKRTQRLERGWEKREKARRKKKRKKNIQTYTCNSSKKKRKGKEKKKGRNRRRQKKGSPSPGHTHTIPPR